MIVLGWALVILGFLFILLAFAGAAAEFIQQQWNKVRSEKGFTAENIEVITKLINAFTGLLKVLFTGPRWFLSFLVGLFLVYGGLRLQAGLSLLPFID